MTINACYSHDVDATIATLYEQMHESAMSNPNEAIQFNFCDWNPKLIQEFRNFYTSNTQLIPNNLTLRISQAHGDRLMFISEVEGRGFIDKNFRETAKEIAEQCEQKPRYNPDQLTTHTFLNSINLTKRKAFEEIKKSERPVFDTTNELTEPPTRMTPCNSPNNPSNKSMTSSILFGLFSASAGLAGASLIVAGITTCLLLSTIWPVGLIAGGAVLVGAAGFFGYKACQPPKDNKEQGLVIA